MGVSKIMWFHWGVLQGSYRLQLHSQYTKNLFVTPHARMVSTYAYVRMTDRYVCHLMHLMTSLNASEWWNVFVRKQKFLSSPLYVSLIGYRELISFQYRLSLKKILKAHLFKFPF